MPRASISLGGLEVLIFGEMGRASWALINLILTVLGAIFAALTGARAIIEKTRAKREMEETGYYGVETSSLRLGWMAVMGIAALVMIILFALTQDMSAPMVLMDWWTLVHMVAMALIIVAIILVFKRLTITFDTDIDGKEFKKKVRFGNTLDYPGMPHRSGYHFDGWYTDNHFKDKWDFDEKVYNNGKLFARWEEIKA